MYQFAIRRPITTLMFALALCFFGVMAQNRMPVSLFPDVDIPVVTITTTYKGANPETIESKVTDKIEEAIGGIDGMDQIFSTSAQNLSYVTAQFVLSKDIEVAVNDVRDKLSALNLGSEVDKPIIQKFDVGAAPVLSIFLSSTTKESTELMKHADQVIKPLLQRIQGVGKVNLVGYKERVVQILPDPFEMNRLGLDYRDIAAKIGAENLKIDGGRLIASKHEWKITTDADATLIEELGNIQILPGILLKEIAKVQDGLQEARSFASFGESPGVILEIQKISGSNEIAIAQGIKERLPYLRSLSEGYELSIMRDTTQYIQDSIDDARFDLLLGGVLATLIVLLFLRNLTVTLVAFLSLPISILGTFAIMSATGQSLNLLTLIALTLSIGIIIDDAIVVIENIYKKLEEGMERSKAALEGVREIGFSIIAISAMLLSVFVPVANMGGVVGRFFTSFGVTVSTAIIISYIVVITFIPMISSLIANPEQNRFYRLSEPFFVALDRTYLKILEGVLRFRYWIVLAIFLLFAFSLSLAGKLGMNFMPDEDKSEFELFIKAQPGISIEEMHRQSALIQEELLGVPEVRQSVLYIGYTTQQKVYESKIYVKLSEIHERTRSQDEIMQELRRHFSQRAGLTLSLSPIPNISGGENNSPFKVIFTAQTTEQAKEVADRFTSILRTMKGAINIQDDLEAYSPEYRLTLRREALARLNLTAQEVATSIMRAFSGDQPIAYYREKGKEYDIILRLEGENRADIASLSRLQLRLDSGEMLSLEGIAMIEEREAITSIKRKDRQRQVMVSAYLDKGGLSLGELVNAMEERKEEWLLEGVSYDLSGDIKNMKETSEAFGIAMIIAIVMIYLILASLYESLLQPLIIMTALPLSFTGAFLALFVSGQTQSLFSLMGLLLLLGMVGKNSTLLVDVANHKLRAGASVKEALLGAGESRLRPILMTTIAMVFGMLPLAISQGAGSAAKAPMGITMIGGLIISMILSLLIVPAIYSILAPLDQKLRRFYER